VQVNNIFLANVLEELYPEAVWSFTNGVGDIKANINIDKNLVSIRLIELQAEYDAQEYARLRKEAYPSIEECIHAILDDDLDALQAKRAEIKARYPK